MAFRLWLGNRAMDAINLSTDSPDVREATKLGIVAANIEIAHKMVNDPEMMAKHGKEILNAVNKIFGNETALNNR